MGTFGDTPLVNRVGYLLCVGSFVFQLIGFATTYWWYFEEGEIHSGLWQSCSGSIFGPLPSCRFDGAGCSQLKGTQATETLSFIFVLAGIVLIVLGLFVLKEKEALVKYGGFSCFIAGMFALVGVILFTTMHPLINKYLHFSFAFCVIAAVGGITGGIVISWSCVCYCFKH